MQKIKSIHFFTLVLIVLFNPILSWAQQDKSESRIRKINLGEAARDILQQELGYTAVVLKVKEKKSLGQYSIRSNGRDLSFHSDAHSPSDEYYSQIIHFDQIQTSIEWGDYQTDPSVELILINGSGGKSIQTNKKQEFSNNSCDQPTVVSQEEWRSGLNAPSYNRSFSTVYNLIVHHSAGSNSTTNFVQAVRDIYILHTQEFGWSDIGYNYLIDPEGTIYAGRDPAAGAQDNVIGAHFCGANSGTMGVCLLGNYETASPSQSMISSLQQVLSWKVAKEDQLIALGEYTHPNNSSLKQIAGHRDGCSTLCPGANVYSQLADIRMAVDERVNNCGGGEEPIDPEPDPDSVLVLGENGLKSFLLYPNPTDQTRSVRFYMTESERARLSNIYCLNTKGEYLEFKLWTIDSETGLYELTLSRSLAAGLYLVHFILPDKQVSKKLMLE